MAHEILASRVFEWLNLDQTDGASEAEAGETGEQPRNEDDLDSTAVVVDLEVTGPMIDTGYSLEDILQFGSLAGSEVPEKISLPDSQSGYSSTSKVSSQDSKEIEPSLDALQQFDTIVPATVQLLLSQDLESCQSDRREREQTPPSLTHIYEYIIENVSDALSHIENGKPPPLSHTYEEIIENAGNALSHIQNGNLKAKSRHEKASIVFYDNLHDGSVYSESIENIQELPSLGNRSDLRQRLIVVEDLSKLTIATLGNQFKINPRFFEEHLLNSGYSGSHFNQSSSKTWSTASLQKSYVCMKWFRPVWQTPTYFSNRDLHDLLKDKTEHFTHRGALTTRAETNIFRSEWDLWTDPEKTTRVRRECGWEEKVSIWSGSAPSPCLNCQVVIILLDPLPQISEQERFFKKESLYEAGNPDETSALFPDIPENERLDIFVDGITGIFRRNEDDLPRRINESSKLFDLWKCYLMRQSIEKHVDHEPVYRCIIEQMAPRKNVQVDLDQIFQEKGPTVNFGTSLTETKSTRDEFCEALDYNMSSHISLVFPLLKILCRDTFALLQQLRHTLDEIDIEILNDERMEDRLALWRQIIGELPELATSIMPFVAFMAKIDPDGVYEEGQKNDPDGKLDLKRLLKDIKRTRDRLRGTSASLTSNMSLLDSRRSIDKVHAVTRLTELAFIFIPLSFAASVFGMQIKPLANPVPIWWFFVVAVVATGRSYMMRIVMRSQWFAHMKIGMKADIKKYADKHGKPVQSRSLAVSLIIQWGISSLFFSAFLSGKWAIRTAWIGSNWIYMQMRPVASFFLPIGIIVAVPIGILKTHHLSPGLQTAVSLGMVLAIIFTLGTVLSLDPPDRRTLWTELFRRVHTNHEEQFDPSRNRLRRRVRAPPRWLGNCLLWLIPLVTVLVIPMALLWTRSIAMDIKVGVTLGICVLVFFAMIYLVLQRLHQRVVWSLPRRGSVSSSSTTST
ncbi:Mg2+ transporter protein CorA-like/Zinc transport protein ZntB [Penicillium malachiteum]|uniref:Mg2+ transporter protein CorA-like/Zinc transport protein ZntB n=1 Tax=Penicillium malachiteum TaxID=1324776 RepID=UPI0025470B10|nr:Mg2+ transporter protein CorA-like/Zinc transport protein ZntB [Penicillium malachiteum]KAJ5736580.1 Mg2+ transporter protein CorA-like/Zinc transport protein ZntB [Penicillium malachiteum]